MIFRGFHDFSLILVKKSHFQAGRPIRAAGERQKLYFSRESSRKTIVSPDLEGVVGVAAA